MAAIQTGEATYSLYLTFLTATNEKFTMTIPDVKSNVTEEEVIALMDTIITNNSFVSKKGALTSKAGAKLVQVAKASHSFV